MFLKEKNIIFPKNMIIPQGKKRLKLFLMATEAPFPWRNDCSSRKKKFKLLLRAI
jgi:hypothetical protein